MDWRNLGQRVMVGVIFIPVILGASWYGKQAFLFLIEVIIGAGLIEFYNLAKQKHARPQRELGIIAGLGFSLLIYAGHSDKISLLLTGLAVLLLLVELFRKPEPGGSPLLNAATTIFGVVYVAGLLSFLVLIREMPRATGAEYAHAGTWLILIFVTIWICDTAAYFVGKGFGTHKLYERVSPKKTWEGAIGGLVFAVLAALACHGTFVKGLRMVDAAVIGLLAGTVGQMSDLVESLFKRDAGVKDSSILIPGHGGMLDRFDSEMLVAPLVYLYLLAVGV
ncbi:phosphatidate cytidylyltransferase [candidate division KSB1 bacterium]|nr:phosphatidate cytidylyltransferase [candidate division KSB1 bacterium]